MRRRLVLDASAAVHIVCELPSASALLEIVAQTGAVMVPDFYAIEVANALWKYVEFDDLEREEAIDLLREARSLVDLQISQGELVQEALVAAIDEGHPVYDMLYAVLARRNGAGVLTKDRRLLSTLEAMGIEAITA